MHASRVGFISNASGERFALPGPSRAENQLTVPCSAFDTENIVGQLLVKLKPSSSGNGFELARESDGQLIQSVTIFCYRNSQRPQNTNSRQPNSGTKSCLGIYLLAMIVTKRINTIFYD